MRTTTRLLRGRLLAAGALAAGCAAQDWPEFRGAAGDGKSPAAGAPIEWGRDRNVKWRVAMPRPGNGSAIVVGSRVFVTSAEDADGKRRSLYCLDRETGERRWVRTVEIAAKMPTHKTNPYCGTTPAADDERVVVWHGSAGLVCYDREGEELWRRDFGEFRHMWGYGTSPVLHDGRVVLHSGPGERVFVAALDLTSGDTLWRTDEPVAGDGQHNENGKYMGSWSTPVVARVGGAEQILCSLATRLVAYDPDSGQVLWFCRGVSHARGDLSYSSPVLSGDVCTVIGGFQGPGFAVRMAGAEGDVTETHRLWRREKFPQNIGSGVAVGEYVYVPHATAGAIECLDPRTGESLWRTRASRAPFWGSIVHAAGHCYVTDQRGRTVVFAPSPEALEVVATNELGERCNATPAIARGAIFLRTHRHVYCIAEAD